MGFYSSVNLYRPGPPPKRVTGLDLARFVSRFAALGLHSEPDPGPERRSRLVKARLRFGAPIDKNRKPITFLIPTAVKNVFTTGEIEWDVETSDVWSLHELAARLAEQETPIDRAFLMLGKVNTTALASLRWTEQVNGEWNGFEPDLWSFAIRPLIYDDKQQREHHLGWMDISFSGNGYFFPCRPKDVIDQVRSHPRVAPLENICRELWPVKLQRPSRRDLAVRREMAKTGAWPYEAIDQPLDWCWGAIGCGA